MRIQILGEKEEQKIDLLINDDILMVLGAWWNGIHGTLKTFWSQDHAGSSPVAPTLKGKNNDT